MKKRERALTGLFAATISFLLLTAFSFHNSRNISTAVAVGAASGAVSFRRIINHPHNLATSDLPFPSHIPTSILFPDWEVLVLPPPQAATTAATMVAGGLSCIFSNGAESPARPLGSGAAFLCSLPPSARRLRPFRSPRLSAAVASASSDLIHVLPPEMLRWNRLAYESISTADDVIVFAKGVNTRQGVNRPAAGIRCIFLSGGFSVAATNATSSAQEVFRCPHPDGAAIRPPARVSVDVGDGRGTIPSLARYQPAAAAAAAAVHHVPPRKELICACTMVYNVAKFLREWVLYHAAIGIDRFLLYDNGSDDGLTAEVDRLVRDGFDVRIRLWLWPKMQEAGFSHAAMANLAECAWIAFIDVDEFLFNPTWAGLGSANRNMIRSIVGTDTNVGQVWIRCLDFGPSGQRAHPLGGVTQGYTCRRAADERHKSLVRPEAVAPSLANSVHHFELGEGWEMRRLGIRQGAVNHYKYQAWEEFQMKFRRRVSAYVADWREAVNSGSKDRTPGLGFEPVEPEDWAGRFCEVNDTRLRDVTRTWFGKVGSNGEYRMNWE